MSWQQGWSAGAALAVCTMLLLVSTVAAEETLVARLPMGLEGDVAASAQQATAVLRADPTGQPPRLPHLQFTAAEARLVVTNFSHTESHVGPSQVDNLLEKESGGSDPLFPEDLHNVQFVINQPTDRFYLAFFDGATGAASYTVHAIERTATLDVHPLPTTVSYTEDPRTLDHKIDLPENTFSLHAPSVDYEIRGDFTFVLHGAMLTALVPDQVHNQDTGTWTRTEQPNAGPVAGPAVSTTTTTAYVTAELRDAVLTLTASGGDQALYAGSEAIRVDVDGALTTDGAAGTLQIGDQTVRSRGDRVRAEGVFHLTPIEAISGPNKQVVFAMDGRLSSLAVGPTSYILDDGIVAVSASVLGLGLLAGLGAYFWPTLKGAALVPLYAKLTKAKVLDQGTRQQVHRKVEADPGCQVKQIADALDISWTTASYHLRVLCKMGLVVGKRIGRHEHFFVAGSRAAAGHRVITALQNDTARQIVEVVLRHPGIIQKDLCDVLKIAPSTASGHLARLRDVGIVHEQREWKKRRYFAGDALQGVPLQIELPPVATEVAAPA